MGIQEKNVPEVEEVEDTVGVNAHCAAYRRVVCAIASGVDDAFGWRLHGTVVVCDTGIDAVLSIAGGASSLLGLGLDVLAVFGSAAGLARILLSDLRIVRSVDSVHSSVCGVRLCSSSLARRHACAVDRIARGMFSSGIVRG